jgi:hypothetical protein
MPETRFPVCGECHFLMHTIDRRKAEALLFSARERNHPGAYETLLELGRKNA